MVISNLICIQITSPGGTPIRGKNAGYRKPLLISPLFLLTAPPLLHRLRPPPPPPPVTSVCPHFQLSVLFHLLRHFLCLHHITAQKCVWPWERRKQKTDLYLIGTMFLLSTTDVPAINGQRVNHGS